MADPVPTTSRAVQESNTDPFRFVAVGEWQGASRWDDGRVVVKLLPHGGKTNVQLRGNEKEKQFEAVAQCQIPALMFDEIVRITGRLAPVTFEYSKKTNFGRSEEKGTGKSFIFEALKIEKL